MEMIKNENIDTNHRELGGLHRPFNKPLKSLTWVCLFVFSKFSGDKSSLYIEFYRYIISETNRRKNTYTNIIDGCISPTNAERVANLIKGDNLKDRIKSVLNNRHTEDDRLIYSTYKNTCYYITLAKKLGLLNSEYSLTSDGLALKGENKNFVKLSEGEKKLLFRILLETNYEIILSLIVMKNDIENEIITIPRAIKYLRSKGLPLGGKYVRSFQQNYLNVIFSWIEQLDLITERGQLRKKWIKNLVECSMSYLDYYKSNLSQYQAFKKKILIKENKLEEIFTNIFKTYDALKMEGYGTLGYINLYDIMDKLHMTYSRFNEILNSFYSIHNKDTIILFSNIVSSVDQRRRFIIQKGTNRLMALKIKIIKKSK